MITRIVSAIVAIPILSYVLFKGSTTLLIATFLITLVGLYEFYRIFPQEEKPNALIFFLATCTWFFSLFLNKSQFILMPLLLAIVFVIMVEMVLSHKSIKQVAMTLVGFIYVVLPLSHIVMIDQMDIKWLIIYPFVIAFVADSFAYFTGKAVGKRKLIPHVSPNKTVEGAVGGILGSTITISVITYLIYPDFLFHSIFLGLMGSVLSIFGDLIASKLKRIYQVKDFGQIMPGHGGVLDRFDGVMMVMPLVYYYFYLFF